MLAAVRGGQVRVAGSARREPPRGLTLMKTSRFLAGLPCFSATKARGGRLRGRAHISEPTAPRRRKRAVDQAIESSHHTQSERHIGSHRPASLSTRQTIVLQSHLSKLLCFRYASAMTKFEYVYEIAADNHGLITSAQAREAGIRNNELVQYAKRGRIAKVGHGSTSLNSGYPIQATRTHGRSCPSDPVPCSTANPSSPCLTLPPQTPPACSWQLLDEHGESFRIASKSNG